MKRPTAFGHRGFTLIEIVTVWCIIAILGAILFPVFAKAREKAHQCACLSNLSSIGAALKMYAADNWGHLPPTNNDLQSLLARALPDPAALRCPTLRHKKPIDYPPPPPKLLEPGHVSDYVYRAGLCDDDGPNQIVAGDAVRDLHNGGANLLFLDGHAKWIAEKAEFPDLGLPEIEQLQEQLTGKPAPPPAPPPPPLPEGGPGK